MIDDQAFGWREPGPGTPQGHSPYLWKRSSSPNSLPLRPLRTCWDEQGGEETHSPKASHCHPGKGPHPAFMPRAVIQICVGTVHGPVTHRDDPGSGCSVLIGFLEKRAQSEGQQQGLRGQKGACTRAYLEVILQPTELSLDQMAAIVEKEIHLSGERDDMGRTQVPATGVKRQGSEI